jgi:predicted acylesterase/phospholipase RssA
LVFSQADHTYLVRQSDAAFVASTPHSILRSRNKDRYIILVAANGGGIQSAAWTAEVLTRIDEECRKVDPDEDGCRNAIALISGVSGGSVGTMYFVDGYGDTEDPAAMNEVVRRSASRSSLAYVGGGLVFNDAMRNVPLLNWVFANEMDRGKHLMQGWIRNRTHSECESLESRHLACDSSKNLLVPTRLSQTMSQWGNNIANERRPAVIFNATMVESGRRLLFSSAHFETKPKETADWITFNQLFGDSNDVDVVEAVRLSASFPFVTPAAASLGGNGSQNDHVVDGGYFDNYGLMSVRDFVADSLSTNPFDSENRPKVIVIQIYGDEVVRDVNGDPDPEKSRQLNQHRFGLFSWYQQTFAPLNTMLSVRQTSQYSRNEDAFNEIVRLLEGKADVSHFVFKFSKNKKIISAKPDQPVDALDTVRESPASVAAEDYEPPPLSWHLTTREKTAIKQVSCEMRSGLDLNENTTNWKSLMDLLRNPKSTGDWNRCSTVDQ